MGRPREGCQEHFHLSSVRPFFPADGAECAVVGASRIGRRPRKETDKLFPQLLARQPNVQRILPYQPLRPFRPLGQVAADIHDFRKVPLEEMGQVC